MWGIQDASYIRTRPGKTEVLPSKFSGPLASPSPLAQPHCLIQGPLKPDSLLSSPSSKEICSMTQNLRTLVLNYMWGQRTSSLETSLAVLWELLVSIPVPGPSIM